MDDNRDLVPAQRHENAVKSGGLAGVDADTAGAEPEARGGQSAQPGGDMSMPPLKRIVLTLADLIEAQLTVDAGPQSVPVPGTDFTEEGVRLLLRELGRRSETPGAPGRFLAWWLLTFLTRSAKGEETFVAGANLPRLQRLAIGLDRIRSQRPAPSTSAPAPHGDDEDADDAMESVMQREDAIAATQTADETPVERPTKPPHSKPARRSKKTQEPPAQEGPAG